MVLLMQYYYLCAKFEGKDVLPTAKYRLCPLLQASARARMHGDEATADGIVVWCWCCCGLCGYTHAHTTLLCEEGYTCLLYTSPSPRD